jgi:hypothetical protein
MTEAEKRAVAIWMETNDLESHEDAECRLAELRAAGLAIVERPQRKPLPDCEGWWWVKPRGEVPMALMVFTRGGGLCVWGQDMSQVEWAIGPLEVPE